jgi:cell division protein FtsA
VLDIGSDLVKALVVRREEQHGVVLGASWEPQGQDAMRGGAVGEIEPVIDTCDRALERAEDMARTVPGEVVVGISGEMVMTFSATVTCPRQRPWAPVRRAELRDLLRLIGSRAREDARHLLALEGPGVAGEVRQVQFTVCEVLLDGRPAADPVGRPGRDLEITVFVAFAPAAQVTALETIARKLDLDVRAVVSRAYALARGCASPGVRQRGGIYVDVGGETTEVALVRNGVIEGSRLFALGGRAFTGRIANAFGLSGYEAEARKLRHSGGLLLPDRHYRLSCLLAPDVDVVLQGLSLCVGGLAGGRELPPYVYVCGGGSLLPEVMRRLEEGAWAEGLPFERLPRCTRLEPSDIGAIVDTTGLLVSAREVGPVALAAHGLTASRRRTVTVPSSC